MTRASKSYGDRTGEGRPQPRLDGGYAIPPADYCVSDSNLVQWRALGGRSPTAWSSGTIARNPSRTGAVGGEPHHEASVLIRHGRPRTMVPLPGG